MTQCQRWINTWTLTITQGRTWCVLNVKSNSDVTKSHFSHEVVTRRTADVSTPSHIKLKYFRTGNPGGVQTHIRLSGACVDDSTVWSPTSTYWRDVGWVTAPPGGGACYLKSIFSRCMSQPGVLLLCSRRQSESLSLHCNWYWQKKNNELEHLWYLQISIRVTKVIWKKKSFRNDLLRHL